MNIYLIERPAEDVGWDEAAGFVVAAPDEDTARQLAGSSPGDEGPHIWHLPTHTTCTCIGTRHTNEAGIILCNFKSA